MLIIAAPPGRNGIGKALADAFDLDVDQVLLIGEELHIDAPEEVSESVVQEFVLSYVPPTPPVPVATRRAEARTKAAAANSVVALRTAFLEFMDTF